MEYILNNTKEASQVADILVHNYTWLIYAFNQYCLGDYLPVLSVVYDFSYKFDKEMVESGDVYIY